MSSWLRVWAGFAFLVLKANVCKCPFRVLNPDRSGFFHEFHRWMGNMNTSKPSAFNNYFRGFWDFKHVWLISKATCTKWKLTPQHNFRYRLKKSRPNLPPSRNSSRKYTVACTLYTAKTMASTPRNCIFPIIASSFLPLTACAKSIL